jgi:hypothetical protein
MGNSKCSRVKEHADPLGESVYSSGAEPMKAANALFSKYILQGGFPYLYHNLDQPKKGCVNFIHYVPIFQ